MKIYFAGHPAGWESGLKGTEQETMFIDVYGLSRLTSYFYNKETEKTIVAIKEKKALI